MGTLQGNQGILALYFGGLRILPCEMASYPGFIFGHQKGQMAGKQLAINSGDKLANASTNANISSSSVISKCFGIYILSFG